MGSTFAATDQSFDEEVLKAGKTVVVDFWAEWCGPCRALAPKLEEIAEENGDRLKVVKVNIDENPDAPAKYGVRGIPTLIIFKDGKEVEQIVGNFPKEKIMEVVGKHC